MASALDVANCFLFLDKENDGEGISNLKLQKLVYYAKGFYLAIFGKHLFDEPVEAWTHGPVVPDLYHKYKGNRSGPLSVDPEFNPSKFTKDQYELIQEVYEVFGQFSAWKLRDMTHEETPWINNEKHAGEISSTELEEYFKTRIN